MAAEDVIIKPHSSTVSIPQAVGTIAILKKRKRSRYENFKQVSIPQAVSTIAICNRLPIDMCELEVSIPQAVSTIAIYNGTALQINKKTFQYRKR